MEIDKQTIRMEPNISRRKFAASLMLGTSSILAGCSSISLSSDSTGQDDGIEVIVDNITNSPQQIAVIVKSSEHEMIFEGVFELEPDELGKKGEIKEEPKEVIVFTPDGMVKSWEYSPKHSPEFNCENENIGISITAEEGIKKWYDC